MHPIIHEASIPGIFRLILIVAIVYAVYSLFIRFVIPSLMRKYISDFQKRFTEENQREKENLSHKKEGEISISYVDKDKNTKNHSEAGEYVDYEEIK